LQKVWFFPIFTYNLHATCYKHVLYCKIDYIGARIGIYSYSFLNLIPNPMFACKIIFGEN
jgi:hypothetical protein